MSNGDTGDTLAGSVQFKISLPLFFSRGCQYCVGGLLAQDTIAFSTIATTGAVIDPTEQLTRSFNDRSAGDPSAPDRQTPIVYAERHRIAERKLFHDRYQDLLQPSTLANEAFDRLMACSRAAWQDHAHFFTRSARIMRHVLVDFDRRHRIPQPDLSSMSGLPASEQLATDLLDVDAALNELAETTVNREWQRARAWLFKRLRPSHGTR